MDAFNQLIVITNRDEIAENCKLIKQVMTDTGKLDKEVDKLQNEIEVVSEMICQCVEENAHSAMDQEEYNMRYNGLVARYDKAKDRLEKIEEQRQGRYVKQKKLETFINTLIEGETILTDFDETLWYAVIDKVTVHAEDDVKFTFRDGTIIKYKYIICNNLPVRSV